jgi:hypothetical protein
MSYNVLDLPNGHPLCCSYFFIHSKPSQNKILQIFQIETHWKGTKKISRFTTTLKLGMKEG